MALPDGAPLSSYSRRRDISRHRGVTGSDLMLELFAISKEKGYRHYSLWCNRRDSAVYERGFGEGLPGIQIAGMYAPPFRALITTGRCTDCG